MATPTRLMPRHAAVAIAFVVLAGGTLLAAGSTTQWTWSPERWVGGQGEEGWRVAINAKGDFVAVGGRIGVESGRHEIVIYSNQIREQVIEDAGGCVPCDVAIDDAGRATAVYRQIDATPYTLRASRYIPGLGWGSTQAVSVGTGNDARVAMDRDGNAIAVWLQGTALWANRLVSATGWWSAPVQIADGSTYGGLDIAMGPSGGATAALAVAEGVQAIRYLPGSGWAAPELISGSIGSTPWIQVAIDDQGRTMLGGDWSSGPNYAGEVWTSRYTEESGWSMATGFTNNDLPVQSWSLRMNGEGRAVAAWLETSWIEDPGPEPKRPPKYSSRARVAAFDPAGGWNSPSTICEQVDYETAILFNAIECGIDAFGGRAAVWTGPEGPGRDAAWASQSNGGAWSPSQAIAPSAAGIQLPPRLRFAMGSHGDAVALLTHYDLSEGLPTTTSASILNRKTFEDPVDEGSKGIDLPPVVDGVCSASGVLETQTLFALVALALLLGCRRRLVPAVALALGVAAIPASAQDPLAAVADLNTVVQGSNCVLLSWTAPIPLDFQGASSATRYEIRYSTAGEIGSDEMWYAATPLNDLAIPGAPGCPETSVVSDLAPNGTYCFSLRWFYFDASILQELRSGLSNSAWACLDTIAPAGITDLRALGTTADAVTLAWTATGDDDGFGTAMGYDIRCSSSPIPDDAAFAAAEPAAVVVAWPAAAGTQESLEVTIEGGGSTWYFAIRTCDEKPNWSPISNVASARVGSGEGGVSKKTKGSPCSNGGHGGTATALACLALSVGAFRRMPTPHS